MQTSDRKKSQLLREPGEPEFWQDQGQKKNLVRRQIRVTFNTNCRSRRKMRVSRGPIGFRRSQEKTVMGGPAVPLSSDHKHAKGLPPNHIGVGEDQAIGKEP